MVSKNLLNIPAMSIKVIKIYQQVGKELTKKFFGWKSCFMDDCKSIVTVGKQILKSCFFEFETLVLISLMTVEKYCFKISIIFSNKNKPLSPSQRKL